MRKLFDYQIVSRVNDNVEIYQWQCICFVFLDDAGGQHRIGRY